MHSRTDILAIFFTLMQVTRDRFDPWVSSPRLAKVMQQHLLHDNQAERSEKFWMVYWLHIP